MRKLVKCGIVILILVTCSCSAYPGAFPRREHGPARGTLDWVAGVWQDKAAPGFFLDVNGPQILIARGGRVREAARVLESSADGLVVCTDGYEEHWRASVVAGALHLTRGSESQERVLTRLAGRPGSLSLALRLAKPLALPEERVLAIQKAIRRGREAERALFAQRRPQVLTEFPWLQDSSAGLPAASPSAPPISDLAVIARYGESAELIRDLVQEVGWIDAGRFGYPTSNEAFFLVQHSWDLPLMLAVLPWVEKDAVAGLIDGSTYALLFDRIQLTLGRAQRFGSQLGRAAGGGFIVLPLEDPEGVDARRRHWGMQPLADYVRLLGEPTVKISQECAARALPRRRLEAPASLPSSG